MSADNGVYILQTAGPEFRVAYQQTIDNIYGNFSDDTFQWQGDPEVILEYFQNAPIFSDLESALDKAADIAYNYEYLEYGICVITDFKDWDFNNLRKNYGQEAQSGSR
jgi:indole-3-glycerol phosphate synthase